MGFEAGARKEAAAGMGEFRGQRTHQQYNMASPTHNGTQNISTYRVWKECFETVYRKNELSEPKR